MGGVQDVQCAQLLPRVAQETHAARTHQGGIEFNSCVYTCISMCAVGVNKEFTFCFQTVTVLVCSFNHWVPFTRSHFDAMSTLYFHFYWELASTGNFELRVLPSVLLGLMILTIHTNWGAFRALPLKTVYSAKCRVPSELHVPSSKCRGVKHCRNCFCGVHVHVCIASSI